MIPMGHFWCTSSWVSISFLRTTELAIITYAPCYYCSFLSPLHPVGVHLYCARIWEYKENETHLCPHGAHRWETGDRTGIINQGAICTVINTTTEIWLRCLMNAIQQWLTVQQNCKTPHRSPRWHWTVIKFVDKGNESPSEGVSSLHQQRCWSKGWGNDTCWEYCSNLQWWKWIDNSLIHLVYKYWDPIVGQELLMISLLSTLNFHDFISYNSTMCSDNTLEEAAKDEQRERSDLLQGHE